ncbi:MAG: AMP-binding protein [Gemmatimonadetes bacterium]|jgi:long-chain acyl-CoA synthetase|nr:AMP-binding protein [Gemmatimonadota bacterium]
MSTPATSIPMTLPGLFWDRVRRWAPRVALREKNFGIWEEFTWADYGERVRACGFGLIACGLEPGRSVAIASEGRPEWLFADFGAQSVGGIAVGLYATNSAEQCAYVLEHAEAHVCVVEDQEQFDKIMNVRSQLPNLHWIVVIDPKGLRHVDDPMVLTFAELLEKGRDLERVQPGLLDERVDAIAPDDTTILFYTSGTTGPPKGVMHSHRSLLDGIEPLVAVTGLSEQDETLCYGALCHLSERFVSLLMSLRCGQIVNFAERPETVFQDLPEVSPTFFFGVPRIFEKLKARIDIDMEEATWGKRKVYALALRIGGRRCRARLAEQSVSQLGGQADNQLNGQAKGQVKDLVSAPADGPPSSPVLSVLWHLADLLVLRKLRQRLGLGRVRMAVVAAAPIAPEVLEFFLGLGVPLREAYGMTETGVTVWTPDNGVRLGKAGVALEGTQFRLSSEGEVLCSSPGMMQGYLKNPEATAETLQDGWLSSGDLGSFDDDGYLVFGGRAKDTMILATGRNVVPANLENMLKASDYILDSVVIGDRRPYLTALIVLDEETVSHYAQTHNVPFSTHADLATHPDIVHLIHREIQAVNARWSDREQVEDFRILNWELSSDDDELTPTMKVRRSFLCEQYAELIDEMYETAHV